MNSLPARTLRAVVAMGLFGWAVGVLLVHTMAAIALPSLQKTVLPARFSYDFPAWPLTTRLAWFLIVFCPLFLPTLINPGWRSTRLFSRFGLAKLVAAAALVALIATFVLLSADILNSAAIGGSGIWIGARIAFVLLSGLAAATLVGFFGEGMPGGSPDAWLQPAATPVRQRDALLHGFLSGMIVALLANVAGVAGIDRLLRGLTSFLGESAEVSPLGWYRLKLGFTVVFGLIMASLGGLLVAAVTAETRRGARLAARAISVIPAIALFALIFWFTAYTNDVGEMNTTLAQAAGLDAVPPPRLIVLTGPLVFTYPMSVSLPGDDDRFVGATEHNIQLAADYLRRSKSWTAHTVAAHHLAGDVYDVLLQPDAALRARVDAAERTGSILTTSLVLSKVKRMPKSVATDDVTARLSDTTRFTGGALRLQGEDTVARNRVVTGSVSLPTNLRAGARVALYRQATTSPPPVLPSTVALIAATPLDASGKFSFTGLPAGIYSVGVLLPESAGSDPRRVDLSGTLRVVDLSKDLRGDVGSVRVSLAGR